MMDYQRHPQKATLNLKKHKIDFADAVSVLKHDWGFDYQRAICRGRTAIRNIRIDLFGRVLIVA